MGFVCALAVGRGSHRYEFTLFALNGTLREAELDAHGLLAHTAQLALGAAVLRGRYARGDEPSGGAELDAAAASSGERLGDARRGKLRVFRE